jgi:hypothetical protein
MRKLLIMLRQGFGTTQMATALSFSALGQTLQGMPGTVSRHLFAAVSLTADSAVAKKSQFVHALIRTGSSGR